MRFFTDHYFPKRSSRPCNRYDIYRCTLHTYTRIILGSAAILECSGARKQRYENTKLAAGIVNNIKNRGVNKRKKATEKLGELNRSRENIKESKREHPPVDK